MLLAIDQEYTALALQAASDTRTYARAADPVRDGAAVILSLSGALSPRGSWFGDSTARFAANVTQAAQDDRIGLIALNIDSPGGFVYGTEEAGQAVFNASQKKPVVAIANNMAASAAYWIGSQATHFYAAPGAEVGSIGVRMVHMDTSKMLEDVGIKVTHIAAGRRKVEGNFEEPLTEEALANAQASVDESMADFVAAVARGRNVSKEKVRSASFGEGAVVSARQAAAVGMVDGIQTLGETIAAYASTRRRRRAIRQSAELARRKALI